MKLPASIVFVILALAAPGTNLAEEPWARREALILARVLAYDRNLADRAGASVGIAVLVRPGDHGGEARELASGLRDITNLTMNGLRVEVVELEYGGPRALDEAVIAHGIDALYIGPGLAGDVEDIVGVTRRRRVLSAAAEPSYLTSGASVGVFVERGKPRIHVNLPASRSEGVALLPELLRLAQVIR